MNVTSLTRSKISEANIDHQVFNYNFTIFNLTVCFNSKTRDKYDKTKSAITS